MTKPAWSIDERRLRNIFTLAEREDIAISLIHEANRVDEVYNLPEMPRWNALIQRAAYLRCLAEKVVGEGGK